MEVGTEKEAILRAVQDIADEWENATDEDRDVDGFDGMAIDDILNKCEDSAIFAGYEIYDILMKVAGENMTDGELVMLGRDIAESMLRDEKYWELVKDLDFRQDNNDWTERYKPVQGEDGDLRFETYGKYLDAAKALATVFAKDQGTNLCQHIWTRVDGDGNADIVLNGWHAVNRMDYLVCERPWGNGDKVDSDIDIEAKY